MFIPLKNRFSNIGYDMKRNWKIPNITIITIEKIFIFLKGTCIIPIALINATAGKRGIVYLRAMTSILKPIAYLKQPTNIHETNIQAYKKFLFLY